MLSAYARMRRNMLMRFMHLAFIPLALVGMWVVACDGGESGIPEEWDVRLNGTGSRCSGWLEIFRRGKWKRICNNSWKYNNAEIACEQLHCGSPFGKLEHHSQEPQKQETCMDMIDCQGNETALKDCQWYESNCTHHLAMVCQDPTQASTVSQATKAPSVTVSKPADTPTISLEDGASLCSGTVKPNSGEHLEMACLTFQRKWSELAPRTCQRMDCDAPIELNDLWRKQQPLSVHWEKVQCEKTNLSSGCLNGTKECLSITLVKCSGQDSKPSSSSTETILGILLGLALTGVLLFIFVLPCCRKLMRKYSEKRQHQWIGPNTVNQNASMGPKGEGHKPETSNLIAVKYANISEDIASFHRVSSVAFQPCPESQRVQEQENCNAFKKNSYLSPYAALERATNRSSSPLDNSSDSDYDLSSAQQL